jgi:alkylhydroperoxidase family enzyme
MMLWLIHRLIARQEQRFGVPLDDLRELAAASTAAFLKLLLFAPLASHRRHLPREAWHLARLAATQSEDCGTCVQIVLYFARRDGVAPEALRAALAGGDSLSP